MLNSVVLLHLEQGNHQWNKWVYGAMFVSMPVLQKDMLGPIGDVSFRRNSDTLPKTNKVKKNKKLFLGHVSFTTLIT